MGYAPASSTVTVNSAAAYRFAEYFQKLVNYANSVVARYEEVVIDVNPGTGEARTVFIPKSPESFTHDTDGNLTQDDRWTYGWDAENRLISMTLRTDLPAAMPRRKIEFVYDSMS
jgi:YD repeat-containing protein